MTDISPHDINELQELVNVQKRDLEIAAELGNKLLQDQKELKANVQDKDEKLKVAIRENQNIIEESKNISQRNCYLEEKIKFSEKKIRHLEDAISQRGRDSSSALDRSQFTESPLKLKSLNERSVNLEGQIEDLIEENSSLDQAYKILRAEKNRLDVEIRDLITKEKNDRTTIENLQAINMDLEKSLKQFQTEHESLNSKKDQSSTTDSMVSLIQELSRTNDKLMEEKFELENLVREMQNESTNSSRAPSRSNSIVQSSNSTSPTNSYSTVEHPSLLGELVSSLEPKIAALSVDTAGSEVTTDKELNVDNLRSRSVTYAVSGQVEARQNDTFQTKIKDPNFFEFDSDSPSLESRVNRLTSIIHFYSQRLTNTGPLALNRRLRLQFDITYLTELSEKILDGLSKEVSNIPCKMTSANSIFSQHVKAVSILLKENIDLRRESNVVKEAYARKLEEWSKREIDELMARKIERSRELSLEQASMHYGSYSSPNMKRSSSSLPKSSPVVQRTKALLKKYSSKYGKGRARSPQEPQQIFNGGPSISPQQAPGSMSNVNASKNSTSRRGTMSNFGKKLITDID